MRRLTLVVVVLLALCLGVRLGVGAVGDPTAAASSIPDGRVVVRHGNDLRGWLETSNLAGGQRDELTRPLHRGERRNDWGAVWSPDGSLVAFRRSTPSGARINVARADGSGIRRIVALTDVSQIVPGAKRFGYSLVWSTDGDELAFTAEGEYSCATLAVLSVGLSGRGPRVLWLRPPKMDANAHVYGLTADGRALFAVTQNSDGDCRFGREYGAQLWLGNRAHQLLVGKTPSTIGSASLSRDEKSIVYSANCDSICDLWVATRSGVVPSRRLTRFRNRTQPFDGFDDISFTFTARPTEIVFGRGRTLFTLDTRGGHPQPIVTAPCLRAKLPCNLSTVTAEASSASKRLVVARFTDYGCVECSASSPSDREEAYAVSLDSQRLARIRIPWSTMTSAVQDTHLP